MVIYQVSLPGRPYHLPEREQKIFRNILKIFFQLQYLSSFKSIPQTYSRIEIISLKRKDKKVEVPVTILLFESFFPLYFKCLQHSYLALECLSRILLHSAMNYLMKRVRKQKFGTLNSLNNIVRTLTQQERYIQVLEGTFLFRILLHLTMKYSLKRA